MAAKPATKETRTDDYAAHARDYAGFTKLFTYGAIVSLVTGLFVVLIIS